MGFSRLIILGVSSRIGGNCRFAINSRRASASDIESHDHAQRQTRWLVVMINENFGAPIVGSGQQQTKSCSIEKSPFGSKEPQIALRVSLLLAEDIPNEKSNHVPHCIELRIWYPAVHDVCLSRQCLLVEGSAWRTLGSPRFASSRTLGLLPRVYLQASVSQIH